MTFIHDCLNIRNVFTSGCLLLKLHELLLPNFHRSFLYISPVVHLGVNSSMNYVYYVDIKKGVFFFVSDLHIFSCQELAQVGNG